MEKLAKDWESKCIESKLLLSKVQLQNTELQQEVYDLKQKLKQQNL